MSGTPPNRRITLSRLALWPIRRIRLWAGSYQRGGFYGVARPTWWPRTRRWPFGPQCEHDGRQVTVFAGGERYVFQPAALGRYRGHVYLGTIRLDTAQMAARLVLLNLPQSAARALAAVSSLEGGFDTIQTYDRARFSWGFIQFAAIGGLPRLLQNIQQWHPEQFARYFHVGGIDVEQGHLAVARRGAALRGRWALSALHNEPALWKPFLLAAQDETIQNAQIRTAYENYYSRMLEQVVYLGAVPLALGELFTDEYSRAAVFDRAVHGGIVYAARLFQKAARPVDAQSAYRAAQVLAAARTLEPQHEVRWRRLESLFEN